MSQILASSSIPPVQELMSDPQILVENVPISDEAEEFRVTSEFDDFMSSKMPRNPNEVIKSTKHVNSRAHFDRRDKFVDFGEYMVATLRHMPTDFVDKALAELQYSMSQLNSEAVCIWWFSYQNSERSIL